MSITVKGLFIATMRTVALRPRCVAYSVFFAQGKTVQFQWSQKGVAIVALFWLPKNQPLGDDIFYCVCFSYVFFGLCTVRLTGSSAQPCCLDDQEDSCMIYLVLLSLLR